MIKINGMEDGVFNWPPPSRKVVWDVVYICEKRKNVYITSHQA
jgi:hypothetical protein